MKIKRNSRHRWRLIVYLLRQGQWKNGWTFFVDSHLQKRALEKRSKLICFFYFISYVVDKSYPNSMTAMVSRWHLLHLTSYTIFFSMSDECLKQNAKCTNFIKFLFQSKCNENEILEQKQQKKIENCELNVCSVSRLFWLLMAIYFVCHNFCVAAWVVPNVKSTVHTYICHMHTV